MIRHSRSAVAVGTLAALAALMLMLAGSRSAFSNDIDLLRFNTAKPYVFFLLDTSASMTLSPAGKWVHGNGDDPRSKLYQAKQVLYQVFQEVDDVHFGFAYMNQDHAAAASKHWLYYYDDTLPGNTLPGNWPITYPKPDPNGPVKYDKDGFAQDDVQGDVMTFGSPLDPSKNSGVLCNPVTGTCTAGTCLAPLKLSTEEEKINRFAKLGADGSKSTEIWILATGNKLYKLTVNKPDGSLTAALGQNIMKVKFELEPFSSSCVSTGSPVKKELDLTLWTDFLSFDEDAGSVDPPKTEHNGGVDSVAGFWEFKDILDPTTCGSGHPFSGKGWEGNYDGEYANPLPASLVGKIDRTKDPHCLLAPGVPPCSNLKATTQFETQFGLRSRPLDRGDLLPLDWRTENKDAFLDRLAPNQSDGTPDFHIASYFKDSPDLITRVLPLENPGRSPLFGSGPSPLSKMVVDFRCWYQGQGNKCNDEAFNPDGWEGVAKENDSEWGCRRPYLIVISDGGDSCTGENPCADTADLNSKSSVRTWVIGYGAGNNCGKPPLSCMAQNGKGELLCVDQASALKDELLRILGLIREETRAFASAAVPSIQTNVDQRVFLTDFTPLNNKSVWDGHLDAYLKPVPPVNPPSDLRPDRNKACTGAENEQGCHLWDAGAEILTQVNGLGDQTDHRRVYYPRETDTGPVTPYVNSRRFLTPPGGLQSYDEADKETKKIWEDLWRVLKISFTPGDSASTAAAESQARQIIQTTLSVKSATLTTVDANGKPVTTNIKYLLGDIFHSNPLIIGSPPNTKYFTDDLHGYRDFFRDNELRRKMAVVGSNDGMLHVFDAGTFNSSTKKFGNGTGKELFAFIPRNLMYPIRLLAEGTAHQWGVDGTVTAADVFIDPEHTGTPNPAERDWRTVIFGGLREGGSAYYALDVTQPDKLDGNVPITGNGYVPFCTGGEDNTVNASECGPVPFPATLWEFTDSVRDPSGDLIRLDEDKNGRADLGATWSIPNLGRIRLSEGDTTIEKFVMVVGGGFDRDFKTDPNHGSGNWLYMIDVETGQAIYKRQLDGAVPSEPAAVDTDQDGFFDRIYIGTTTGKLYRVDLVADPVSKKYPALADKQLQAGGLTYTVQRIPETDWAPRLLFDASLDGKVRPIFYRPSVIYVPDLGFYALSFGTGDREDLWDKTGVDGRFFVFVDDSERLPAGTVLDASRFQQLTVTSPASNDEFLLTGGLGAKGWYLVLEENERLITDPFALSGVTFFSTYQPDIVVSGNRDKLCSKTGTSRIFVVSTVNGNPFLRDANNLLVRNAVVNDFVTNPFTEDRLLKSATGEKPGSTSEICDTDTMNQLRTSLMSLFPVNCRFGNQTIDIKTISSKTALVCIAPVPVCTIEKNWREH